MQRICVRWRELTGKFDELRLDLSLPLRLEDFEVDVANLQQRLGPAETLRRFVMTPQQPAADLPETVGVQRPHLPVKEE